MLARLASVLLAGFQVGIAEDAHEPLGLAGPPVESVLRPGGTAFLVTEHAGLYLAFGRGLWHRLETPASERDRFSGLAFFDDRVGMLVGAIGDERRLVLRTDDRGTSFRAVRLPLPVEVVDQVLHPGGRGWLLGARGRLLSSDDFGRTWNEAGRPYPRFVDARSLLFLCKQRGFVSAAGAGLRATTNGGRTWGAISAPHGRGAAGALLADVGGALVAQYDDGCYWRPLHDGSQDDQDQEWRELRLEGRPVISVAEDANGFLAVTDDLHCTFLSPELKPVWTPLEALPARPLAARSYSDAGWATLLLADGAFAVVGKGAGYYPPREADRGTAQIVDVDLDANGVLWADSGYHLYRAREATWSDDGPRWEQVAHTASYGSAKRRSLHAFTDGSGAFVEGFSGLVVVGADTASTPGWPVVDPRRAFSRVRRSGSLWVAMTNETDNQLGDGRPQVWVTDQIKVGPELTGRLVVSTDRAATWTEVEVFEGRHIRAMELTDDGGLVLLLAGNRFLRGRLVTDDGAPRLDVEAETVVGDGKGGLLGWAEYVLFVGPEHGFVGGSTFFDGPRLYETIDGGSTWRDVPPPDQAWVTVHRLGGGALVRVLREYKSHVVVDRWTGNGFEVSREFEVPLKRVKVAASGGLLLRLKNGELWSLDAEGASWTRLHDLPAVWDRY